MTDNVVGILGGVTGFVVGKQTGILNFVINFHDIFMFIIVTVSAGLLGYVGKVLGSVLIKWVKKVCGKNDKLNGK